MPVELSNVSSEAAERPTKREPSTASESEFLDQQIKEAGREISKVLEAIQQALKDSADLKAWTREHPWPSVGVAAVAGFLTGRAVGPLGHNEVDPDSRVNANSPGAGEPTDRALRRAARRGRSLRRKFLAPLLKILAGPLESAILAAVTATFQKAPPETSTNGHQEHPSGV